MHHKESQQESTLEEYVKVSSRVSKFIENLGEDSDLDNDYIEILSKSEEKELVKIADKAYNHHQALKKARLDARSIEHPMYSTLHFTACMTDTCQTYLLA